MTLLALGLRHTLPLVPHAVTRVVLLEWCSDDRSYSQLLTALEAANVTEIIVSETLLPKMIVKQLRAHFESSGSARITAIGRKYFDDSTGLATLQRLSLTPIQSIVRICPVSRDLHDYQG